MTLQQLFAIVIQPKFVSLTANGPTIKVSTLTPTVVWKVSSQLTISNERNVACTIPFDSKNCKAWVVALDTLTGATDTCKVSIVPWVSNLSALKINQIMSGGYRIFGKTGDTLIVNYNNVLYKTGGDLTSLIRLANFPLLNTDYFWAYLRTPAGSFIRNENNIYFSKDEKKWDLDYITRGRGIRNSFCNTYDSLKQTTYVLAHDYSTTGIDTFPHSVYRKSISPQSTTNWEKVFTFYSKDQWALDKTLFPACRHIHTLVADPYTGHLWLGTGDADQHSHIYYSDDNGTTWKHIGMGSQEWRVLSIWFTKNHVYWGMDSGSSAQKIFRISRSVYNKKGFWPDMTGKRLTSGFPKQNILYMIATLKDYKYYFGTGVQAFVGDIVWGNPKIPLDENNSLIAMNDPVLDYRELVATLPNSALWGNTTAIDDKGDRITLISTDAEGATIDSRVRVFGIKEHIDESVDIQELLSTDACTSIYSQLYPYEQDALGNMYFQTRFMDYSIYKWNDIIKTKLSWNDNSKSKGGGIQLVSNNNDKALLKLKDFDGTILYWQKSDKSFNWSDIPTSNSDTLWVGKTKAVNYIRAIVQKTGFSPVASNYIAIDSIRSIPNNILTPTRFEDSISLRCYPNPVTDILKIDLESEGNMGCNVIMLNELGDIVLSKFYNTCLNKEIELSLKDFSSGVYFLKIVSDKKTFNQKIYIR